jgi:acetyl esterase/lipase
VRAQKRETLGVCASEVCTVTWRRVDGLDLLADVYIPARRDPKWGALLWFHGGALILGGRADVPAELVDVAQNDGFHLISVDYRLAPQAGIEQIADDAYAALAWVQTDGADRFSYNGGRTVVAGLSAGGYLALLAGLATPAPKAVVSYYGYGTLDSAWYSEPSSAHVAHIPPVPEAEARASIGQGVVCEGHARPDAWKFYVYCRQTGQWPTLAAGLTMPQQRHVLRRLSPTYQVSDQYPPTLLIHGTADGDVPFEESAAMSAMLALHHVEHELIALEGLDHGLEPGDNPERQRDVYDAQLRAADFLLRHLGDSTTHS